MTVGALTLNVTMPRNNNGELWIFGVANVIIVFVEISILYLVRYWWVSAKQPGARLE
jgi:hypothetical protein